MGGSSPTHSSLHAVLIINVQQLSLQHHTIDTISQQHGPALLKLCQVSQTLRKFSELEQISKNTEGRHLRTWTQSRIIFFDQVIHFFCDQLGHHTRVNGGHYTGGAKVLPSQIVPAVPMWCDDLSASGGRNMNSRSSTYKASMGRGINKTLVHAPPVRQWRWTNTGRSRR
jgi:hypothetical protein